LSLHLAKMQLHLAVLGRRGLAEPILDRGRGGAEAVITQAPIRLAQVQLCFARVPLRLPILCACGAMKLSNNKAEMQAIVEALLFILAQVEEDEPAFAMGFAIIIHSDSRYAVDLIKAGSRSCTNFLLRDFLHHMWRKVSQFFDIRIVWVRGHDKTVGNEEADKHAGDGAEVKDDTRERHRRPSDWGFHEFRRDFPHRFAQGQKMAFHLFQCENEGTAKGANPALDARKRKIAGRPNIGTK
jgi:ribonuclease HI